MCSKKLGMKGLLFLVIPVTFPSIVTFKMPNSNHGNSKNFDSWLWSGGEKGYQTLKLLERDVNQL